MSQVESNITPAPELNPAVVASSKWDREYRAYLRLLPSLITTHRDQFVAIHDEQVVGSGVDQIEVALAAYSKYGYVPIFVGRVSDAPQQVVRIASPRLHGANGA